jgi:hypothetical protein
MFPLDEAASKTLYISDCVKYWRRSCTAYTMFETLYLIESYRLLFGTSLKSNLHLTKRKYQLHH